MAKDSVELIREAEQAAQKLVGDAHAQAQAIINDAHVKAREQRDEMLTNARYAAEEARTVSREDGAKLLEEDTVKYEKQCEAVRAEAEKKRSPVVRIVIYLITG